MVRETGRADAFVLKQQVKDQEEVEDENINGKEEEGGRFLLQSSDAQRRPQSLGIMIIFPEMCV